MLYYDDYNYEEINNDNHGDMYDESGCAHQSDHLDDDYGYNSNHSYPPISPGLNDDRHHNSEYQGHQDHENEGFEYQENEADLETDKCQVLEYDRYKPWELGEWTHYEERVDQEGLRSEEHGHNERHGPEFKGLEYSRYEQEGFKHQGYEPRRVEFKGTTGGDMENVKNESQRLRFEPDRETQGRYAYPTSHTFIAAFNSNKTNEHTMATQILPCYTLPHPMMNSMVQPPHPSSVMISVSYSVTMETESWGPLPTCWPSKLTQMSAQWKRRGQCN